MAGFLSKSRQKLDHTSKLPFTGSEFKLLGNVISTEKSHLAGHMRTATEAKRAAGALEDWAAAEGPDLADTIGKAAKLLNNDLAKAQEDFAERLHTYRVYFKDLRTREEKFSQLKKNKDSLQNKIDNLEKKISKMNPEHKDLANLNNKLVEMRNEMAGMENQVFLEEAAIADYRRQRARAAVAYKLGAVCELGEKLSIIGELGKLLVAELPIGITEADRERPLYNGYDRTQQIYGEAQNCLHQVNFDGGSAEQHGDQLPVPSTNEFDHSYEYDQDASRLSHEVPQSQDRQTLQGDNVPSTDASYPYAIPEAGQPVSHDRSYLPPGAAERTAYAQPAEAPTHNDTAEQRAPDMFHLPTPSHVENEFAESVNAGWREHQTHYEAAEGGSRVSGPRAFSNESHNGGQADGGQAIMSHSYDPPPPPQISISPSQLSQPDYQEQTNYNTSGMPASSSTDLSPQDAPYPAPTGTPYDSRNEYEQARSEVNPIPISNADSATVPAAGATPGIRETPGTTGREGSTYEPTGEDLYGTGLYGGSVPEEQIQELPTHRFETSPDIVSPAEIEQARHPPAMSSAQTYDTSRSPPSPPPPPVRNVGQPADALQADISSGGGDAQVNRTSSVRQSLSIGKRETVQEEGRAASPIAPPANSSRQKSPPLAISTQTSPVTSKPSPALSPTATGAPTKPSYRKNSNPPKRQSLSKTDSDYGRSSIAYLNEPPPRIEPPMRAPPPVTSILPLPSSSPYFNPYATLRSSSYGQSGSQGNDSGNRTKQGKIDRPDARPDSTLGSRFGFDMKAVAPSDDKALRQQPTPNANPQAVTQKDYTYAIKTDPADGGKRLNAGAFRRAAASSNSVNSFTSSGANDGTLSPAARLRDEWRASNFTTPLSTPADELTSPASLVEDHSSMYNDSRQQHRPPYAHRTSAVDAPTDVADDLSRQSMMQSETDEVLPLNLKKRSGADGQSHGHSGSDVTVQPAGTEGFGSGRFVTALE